MARWCPNSACARHNQEVSGTPTNCADCGQRMSGIRPPSINVPPIARFEYRARRLPEMDPKTWASYQERVVVNKETHKARKPAELIQEQYLYHATPRDALIKIAERGLCPRDPSWRMYNKKDKVPRFDASKDGYLSMATTLSGAGAIGSFVLLRMLIKKDIADWDFRQIGWSTEVRTTIPIPPNRLEWSNEGGKNWEPLVK